MAKDGQKLTPAKLLDVAILGCLFAFAFAAPHSIAGAQTAWLVGIVLWAVRFIFHPRPKLQRTPVDYLLLGFFIITGLSSFLSYEPMVSIGKLRAASLFTIIYLVSQNISSLKVVRLLALTLIISCFGNVIFTLGQRVIGRGIKVHGVSESSALYAAGIRDGDTLLSVNGTSLTDPAQLLDALSQSSRTESEVRIYRFEWQPVFRVAHGLLKPGDTPTEQLGISRWSRGRDWRASGFYGHYVTYAEVLQLIFALTLGLFICLPGKRGWLAAVLLIGLVGFLAALFLTVTRAVWLGCLISSALILLLTMRRRTMILIAALAIPLILAGLFVLQQKRNVGFFDRADHSTTWRQIVWAEGTNLLVSNPCHLLIGVGMDSIKNRAKQWGLFDGGRIPMGHMHSNFLQIALERGIPALLLWLAFLFVYAKTIWQSLKQRTHLGWAERGILLGALGGLLGFLTSGIVHYNWGDSEVIQIFYFIMGLTLVIHRHAYRAKVRVNS
ncbi:MAG TPA: O-antigen ligase family protein [Pyrinomonadaceae bacterium]|nr:O-antigen ligase family protein [Pyrinomonadaceae bacterium]